MAIAALLMLVACAAPIAIDRASDDGTTLRWYTRDASIGAAEATAETHCRHLDKRARMIEEFEDQDVTVARFACG